MGIRRADRPGTQFLRITRRGGTSLEKVSSKGHGA
jgi:hypothetical protein